MSRPVLRQCAWVLFLVCALASPARAQDFRGTLSGTIKDATGPVPGVSVVVKNIATGVSQTVVTDGKGLFQVPYLIPGLYSVTVELKGYKTVVRAGYQVRVAEVTAVEILLEPGLSETVTVTVETPLLNTKSGVSGTTIDAKQIAQLPLGDGTAYMLTRLAPGIMDSSDLHFARPMDNGNLGGIISNGVLGGNEFMIDGAPNMSNTRGVGFSPPSDAISQFKVQTNAYDAQSGHTAGAVVNLSLKSGTNNFHSAVQYFNRDASRAATPLLTQRAGGVKPTRTYNRFTGAVDGPIVKNRTFFMMAFEQLRDVQPEPSFYTVPTAAMRAGNFSEFTTPIYDPTTATGSNLARTAFLNNQIPGFRINPVAAAYAAMYPLPNRPGTVNNYFTNQLRPYDYDAFIGRVNHNLNSGNRIFASAYYNKRREDRYNWAQDAENATDGGVIGGFLVTQGYDYRNNLGLNGGWTSVRSSTTLLDLHASFTRFGEWRDPAQTIDPATLGFSSTAVQAMNGYQYLPFITFGAFSQTNSGSTISSLGSMRSDWGDGFDRPMQTISVAPTLTRIAGGHTFHAGYDFRHQVWDITNHGFPGGRFQFNGMYTRLNNAAPLNDRGQVFAQFLLGLPTALTGAVASTNANAVSSQFEIASPGSFTQMYHGLFLQDDWRVTDRLTVNLGLRYEANLGMSETQDRNLGGFDTTSASPIEAAAVAAYSLNPIPQIPVGEFKVKGGLLFADGPINDLVQKFLPRAAAAYRIGEQTVVRGGIGQFSYDYFFENINQAGFSQATPVLVTNDNGLTFTGATLSDPLPSGQLIQPVGSALGLSSQLGQGLGTLYQPDREGTVYTRWEFAVQRDLGHGFLAAFTYIGSEGSHLPVVRQVNNIPMKYLSTSRQRDAATETLLSGSVPNPMAGLLPGSAINGATVARNQLLRPYPQFAAFGIEEYGGSDRYKASTIQLEKRFGSGNSFTIQYTHSDLRDKLNYLNPADQVLEDRVSPNDRPNRVSIGTSLRLPFGKDERWGKDWNTAVDLLAGGWQMSGTYQFQSGFPITWGNLYFDSTCDINSLRSNIGQNVNGAIAGLDTPGWDTSCFYFHDAAVQTNGVDDPVKQRADTRIQLNNNVRYFPSTLPGMRNEALHLLDVGIYKNFKLPNRQKLQLRIEFINALNYAVLFAPDANPRNATFGFVTSDRNNPRDIQIGLRWTF